MSPALSVSLHASPTREELLEAFRKQDPAMADFLLKSDLIAARPVSLERTLSPENRAHPSATQRGEMCEDSVAWESSKA